MFKVVERKSVKGTPVLYVYAGAKYLGSLMFADESTCDDFKLTLEVGGDVSFVEGPDLQGSVS